MLLETTIAQIRYKANFPSKVQQISIFAKGDLVYKDNKFLNPPKQTKHPTQKLRAKKTDQYMIVKKQPKTLTVEKDGIPDVSLLTECQNLNGKLRKSLPPYPSIVKMTGVTTKFQSQETIQRTIIWSKKML